MNQACMNTQVTNIIVYIGPVSDICKWLQGIKIRLLLPQDQSPVPCDPIQILHNSLKAKESIYRVAIVKLQFQ